MSTFLTFFGYYIENFKAKILIPQINFYILEYNSMSGILMSGREEGRKEGEMIGQML